VEVLLRSLELEGAMRALLSKRKAKRGDKTDLATLSWKIDAYPQQTVLTNRACVKECEEKHSNTTAHHPVVKPPTAGVHGSVAHSN